MGTYIDLTLTLNPDMPVYPGDRQPKFRQVAFLEKDGFTDFEVTLGMHVGTHMDAPLHMIEGGRKLSEIPVEKFFGRGALIDARGKEKINASLLVGVRAGDIVLVLTGWGQKFREPEYFETYPELAEDFANKLVELKVKMVGTDTPSPDRAPFKVHKILLAEEILILENLINLEQLVGKNFEVVALPAKFDTEAAPVRAVAKII